MSRSLLSLTLASLTFLALALSACADGQATRDSGTDDALIVVRTPGDPLEDDDPLAAEPTPAEWTAGTVQRAHEVSAVATLAATRAARNEGFDRVVLEFEEDEMPAYHVEYVDRPIRRCGSGELVPIAGDGWLLVRLEPARAHDDEGRATIAELSSRPHLPNLRELTLVCDYEARVEWVLGVGSPNRFRVMELLDPARLVIDVRH
jgi:hypothetical protein